MPSALRLAPHMSSDLAERLPHRKIVVICVGPNAWEELVELLVQEAEVALAARATVAIGALMEAEGAAA